VPRSECVPKPGVLAVPVQVRTYLKRVCKAFTLAVPMITLQKPQFCAHNDRLRRTADAARNVGSGASRCARRPIGNSMWFLQSACRANRVERQSCPLP
jgi:hypothetical protein